MSQEIQTHTDNLEIMGQAELGPALLAEHMQIAKRFGIEHPYWLPLGLHTENVHVSFQRGSFQVTRGTIETYSPEERAVFVDATIKRFVANGLFGCFPWAKTEDRERLIASMIGGFTSNRLIAALYNRDRTQLIGGCMVVPGENPHSSLLDLNGHKDSTLPSLWSLRMSPNGNLNLLRCPESQGVCFTRFFRIATDQMIFDSHESRKKFHVSFSKEVLSGMATVVSEWSRANRRPIQTSVLDTHDPDIAQVLITFYGGTILDDNPTPSVQVLQTPLGDHYRLPNIITIGFQFSHQLLLAREVDRSLGPKNQVHYSYPVQKEKSDNKPDQPTLKLNSQNIHDPNCLLRFPATIPPASMIEGGPNADKLFRRHFTESINRGQIHPVIVDASSPINQMLSDHPDLTITATEQNLAYDLYKIIRRFHPQATPAQIPGLMRTELEKYGLAKDTPIGIGIHHLGQIGYFPKGITSKGKLILEKVAYFPEELRMQMMAASSWKLISEEARNEIYRMWLYSVGLSVGSELVDIAVRLGVNNFTLGDPSLSHADAQERLTWWRPEYTGWNKTPIAIWEILKRNPGANISAFYKGLTPENEREFYKGVDNQQYNPVGAEEADHFLAKQSSRKVPRVILGGQGIHTTMIGDVGWTEAIFTHDQPGDVPFGGRVAQADPESDPYGATLYGKQGNLAALFATVGGLRYIPDSSRLLPLVTAGLIGTEISTVPQPRGAVSLAGVLFYEVLLAIAEGRGDQIPAVMPISIHDLLFPKKSN